MKNSNYHIKQVESALNALQILNQNTFTWLTEKNSLLTGKLRRDITPELARGHLMLTIQNKLYRDFYSKGFVTPSVSLTSNNTLNVLKAEFERRLSEANHGKGFDEDGWLVLHTENNNLIIEKNGLKLKINKDDCSGHEKEFQDKGDIVLMRMPKELPAVSPGFFVAFGDTFLPKTNNTPLTRFYWNTSPEGAIKLMDAITKSFNYEGLPFRFKVVNHPNQYNRCDAAVLYTEKKHYEHVNRLLQKIQLQILSSLKYETPVFTKQLAPGLGFAEDPAKDISFGMHRCQILSEAIVRAFNEKKKSLNQRLELAKVCFLENGIDIETPYLNPDSEDIFELFPQVIGTERKVQVVTVGHLPEQNFLKTAQEIGKIICTKAIWHNGQCNWLGMGAPESGFVHAEQASLIYKSLGSDVYSGTAGIAFFLAEIYKETSDHQVRKTCFGAISHAIANAGNLHVSQKGLYDGIIGIAFAAAYIGSSLADEQLLESARKILKMSEANVANHAYMDQLSGNAGIISTLLVLKDLLKDESLLNVAQKLGEEIIRDTHYYTDGCCAWKSKNMPGQKSLLGYSHGTAGISVALLDLYRETCDPKFKHCAESAIQYEQQWYNEEFCGWPDFRGVRDHNSKKKFKAEYPVFWCHGAAGIALSRIRAYKILNDEKYKSQALAALSTTMKWTEKMLGMDQINFSLCHGIGGNAWVLSYGSELLGNDFLKGHEIASLAAYTGLDLYAKNGHRWPLGAFGNHSPGMMIGLSGVGSFYLKMYNNRIPSMLMLDQEEF